MTILLAFYLGGWVGTSATLVKTTCDKELRHVSNGECKVLKILSGAAWPMIIFSNEVK